MRHNYGVQGHNYTNDQYHCRHHPSASRPAAALLNILNYSQQSQRLRKQTSRLPWQRFRTEHSLCAGYTLNVKRQTAHDPVRTVRNNDFELTCRTRHLTLSGARVLCFYRAWWFSPSLPQSTVAPLAVCWCTSLMSCMLALSSVALAGSDRQLIDSSACSNWIRKAIEMHILL